MKKAYTEAVEVEASEMKRRGGIDKEKYAFYEEVCKRLEQTNEKTALRYKFPDARTADLYRKYVEAHFRQERGRGTLSTSRRANDTGMYIYFARGDKY